MGTKLKLLSALFVVCGTLPMWFYLLYQILLRVNASELMWFLFWCYLPLQVFVAIVGKVLARED